MSERWIVIAKTHDGAPFGSARCRDREEAERAAERYADHPKVGSVSAQPLREIATGNRRFR